MNNQCLSNIGGLKIYFLENEEKFEKGFPSVFVEVIANLWKTKATSYAPKSFIVGFDYEFDS
jgi:hypothetical protein